MTPQVTDSVSIVASPTISEVMWELIHHPVDRVFQRWNWKSALLSLVMRGGIFFSVNLAAGLKAAISALVAEIIFRPVVAGYYGTLTQAFRNVYPVWQANLTIMLLLPIINHGLEYGVHRINGTQKLALSIIISMSFTALSALFNLFAMRHGIFVVGQDASPLFEDFKRLPVILVKFLWYLVSGQDRKNL
jgi:hypothetical protein